MNPGAFDRFVTVLERTVVIDALGAEQETWSDLVSMWAAKREIGAAEVLRNPQVASQLTAVWQIRHPGRSIDATMRLRDDAGRLHEISGIRELPGRRVGFEIMTRGLDEIGATVA